MLDTFPLVIESSPPPCEEGIVISIFRDEETEGQGGLEIDPRG